MKEITTAFGKDGNLSGTLTLPQPATSQIGFILLNAGIIHRVGPHRFNVKLARALAERGHACLRFDVSGLGDSRFPINPQATFQQQACADLSEAMDKLEAAAGIKRVAIVGICSGAQSGLALAVEDGRVAGLYMIDGYAYATPQMRWRRALLRLRLHPTQTILSLLARIASRFRKREEPTVEAEQIDYGQSTPPREEFVEMMNKIVTRGTKVAACYTGSWIWRYSYHGQWKDAFASEAFVDAVDIAFEPRLDHTLSTLAAQRRVINLISAWAAKRLTAE